MPESTWLESRKKNRRYYVILSIIAFFAVTVFFYNNRELFFTLKKHRDSAPIKALKTDTVIVSSPADHGEAQRKRDTVRPVVEKSGHATTGSFLRGASIRQGAEAGAPVRSGIILSDIICSPGGREAMKVMVSLEIFVAQEPLKREVLLKRENLKVMVQKVISGKTVNELIVDSLRVQTKDAMNRILEHGVIDDVKFRNFRIEKVK